MLFRSRMLDFWGLWLEVGEIKAMAMVRALVADLQMEIVEILTGRGFPVWARTGTNPTPTMSHVRIFRAPVRFSMEYLHFLFFQLEYLIVLFFRLG